MVHSAPGPDQSRMHFPVQVSDAGRIHRGGRRHLPTFADGDRDVPFLRCRTDRLRALELPAHPADGLRHELGKEEVDTLRGALLLKPAAS